MGGYSDSADDRNNQLHDERSNTNNEFMALIQRWQANYIETLLIENETLKRKLEDGE